jgi:hypothetical protein
MTALNQKTPVRIDDLSLVSLRISAYFKDVELALGTAFIYVHEGQPYFITNWHNVTGRDPTTLKCLHKDVALPDRLQIKIPYQGQDDSGARWVQWHLHMMPLYEDEGESPMKSIWYEHPEHRHNVDVVAIPFDGEESGIQPANDPILNLAKIRLRPSLDVFVLGFPRGMSGGANFPVWKRGSIASEPDIDIDGLPKIFIDTATREGMSGSPVYAEDVGFVMPEGVTEVGDALIGRAKRFLGIYSGRIGADDDFKTQLGIVWKPAAIEEIIQGAMYGTSSFEICPKS